MLPHSEGVAGVSTVKLICLVWWRSAVSQHSDVSIVLGRISSCVSSCFVLFFVVDTVSQLRISYIHSVWQRLPVGNLMCVLCICLATFPDPCSVDVRALSVCGCKTGFRFLCVVWAAFI